MGFQLKQQRKVLMKRALLLLTTVFFIFLLFIGRVVYIQAGKEVKGHDLQAMGEKRWTTHQTLEGTRGTIFDRNGSTLAEEIKSYTAYAVLDKDFDGHVEDVEKTAETLAPYIDMEEEQLKELLSRDRFQVELGPGSKYLTLSEKEEIEALELPGIYFRTEPQRFYPKQTFASHVLGYTSKDMSDARMGLEAALDDILRPVHGSLSYKRNARGTPLWNKDEMLTKPKDGNDVYLTIDANIQTVLEHAMSEVEDTYKPEKITAIVLNAETGEVLGMGNRPSFNPNEYETITNYTNYAISDRIEPGSTMKMFTLAAAIEEGVYNGNETFQSGTYTIGSDTIGDHNNGVGWGEITYDEGLERSSNVAFAKLALEKLTPERFYNYLEAFHFHEKTGIDLPQESESTILEMRKINAAVTSYGQGSVFTPIQLVKAATAIANDGKMMKPYIIDKIYDPNTNELQYEAEPEVVGTPISEETAKLVRQKLEQVVVGRYGTGKAYYIEGLDVAGKTGTAQISNPNGRGYLTGRNQNIFSFLGMAPADDPKIIVFVAVDRPQLPVDESGSSPVSKIFNPVMKQSLSYMNLSLSEEEGGDIYDDSGIELASYVGHHVDEVSEELREVGLTPIVIGDGNEIVKQFPERGVPLVFGEKVFLLTNGERKMPNMTGWSLRDVKRLGDLLEVRVDHLGSGYVTNQSIEPGGVVRENDFITVELKSPENVREILEKEKEDEKSEEEE